MPKSRRFALHLHPVSQANWDHGQATEIFAACAGVFDGVALLAERTLGSGWIDPSLSRPAVPAGLEVIEGTEFSKFLDTRDTWIRSRYHIAVLDRRPRVDLALPPTVFSELGNYCQAVRADDRLSILLHPVTCMDEYPEHSAKNDPPLTAPELAPHDHDLIEVAYTYERGEVFSGFRAWDDINSHAHRRRPLWGCAVEEANDAADLITRLGAARTLKAWIEIWCDPGASSFDAIRAGHFYGTNGIGITAPTSVRGTLGVATLGMGHLSRATHGRWTVASAAGEISYQPWSPDSQWTVVPGTIYPHWRFARFEAAEATTAAQAGALPTEELHREWLSSNRWAFSQPFWNDGKRP